MSKTDFISRDDYNNARDAYVKAENRAFTFAKKLQLLATKTNHCSHCFEQIEKNKRNKETTISGLCTDCQPLYFGSEE